MEESYVSQGVVFEILQYDCHQIQLLYGLYKHIINTLYGKLISMEYVLSRIYVINSCSVMF